MIDIRKLKELVRLMVENDLSEIDLRDQEETVTVKRGPSGTVIQHQPTIYGGAGAAGSSGAPAPAPAAAPAAAPAPSGGEAPAAAPAGDEGLVAVESPMVGSYYSAPNPDSDPFIKVGDTVSVGTTLCLVEAMKVFNEIKSEVNGTVEKILVKNGDAIEFGQKLVMVRPS